MPWNVHKSFMTIYRRYFRAFRSAAHRAAFPLEDLHGRLFVRLGFSRWSGLRQGFSWETKQITDFQSESDLEDSFMSAAFVPVATSFVPPGFRGGTALDAAFVDLFLSEGPGYTLENESLFPSVERPKSADSKINPRRKPTRVVVVPNTPPKLDPTGLVMIKGPFRQLGDFFADSDLQREGFIKGYETAAAMVDTSRLPISAQRQLAAKRAAADELIDTILAEYAEWKEISSLAVA